MVLSRVLSFDEAYSAISWSTVFLLASLIPLGQAVQNTGTADWIAAHVLGLLEGWPLWSLQAGLALLATGFTLVMSNVGATVLLVPLAVSIAVSSGQPRRFCFDGGNINIEFLSHPNASGECAHYGSGWLQSNRLRSLRRDHDNSVSDCIHDRTGDFLLITCQQRCILKIGMAPGTL